MNVVPTYRLEAAKAYKLRHEKYSFSEAEQKYLKAIFDDAKIDTLRYLAATTEEQRVINTGVKEVTTGRYDTDNDFVFDEHSGYQNLLYKFAQKIKAIKRHNRQLEIEHPFKHFWGFSTIDYRPLEAAFFYIKYHHYHMNALMHVESTYAIRACNEKDRHKQFELDDEIVATEKEAMRQRTPPSYQIYKSASSEKLAVQKVESVSSVAREDTSQNEVNAEKLRRNLERQQFKYSSKNITRILEKCPSLPFSNIRSLCSAYTDKILKASELMKSLGLKHEKELFIRRIETGSETIFAQYIGNEPKGIVTHKQLAKFISENEELLLAPTPVPSPNVSPNTSPNATPEKIKIRHRDQLAANGQQSSPPNRIVPVLNLNLLLDKNGDSENSESDITAVTEYSPHVVHSETKHIHLVPERKIPLLSNRRILAGTIVDMIKSLVQDDKDFLATALPVDEFIKSFTQFIEEIKTDYLNELKQQQYPDNLQGKILLLETIVKKAETLIQNLCSKKDNQESKLSPVSDQPQMSEPILSLIVPKIDFTLIRQQAETIQQSITQAQNYIRAFQKLDNLPLEKFVERAQEKIDKLEGIIEKAQQTIKEIQRRHNRALSPQIESYKKLIKLAETDIYAIRELSRYNGLLLFNPEKKKSNVEWSRFHTIQSYTKCVAPTPMNTPRPSLSSTPIHSARLP